MQEVVGRARTASQDGRSARAERTRNAVVDALLDLIDEGQVRPAAAEVAQRAGVSLRSLYQHFDDVETLFRVAAERHQLRVAHLEQMPDLPADLGRRVRVFVEHRARWLEANSPMRRAAALQQPFSDGVANRLAAGHRRHRDLIATVFAPELSRPPESERLLWALEAATTWTTWEHLRSTQGLARDDAVAVMELTLSRLLRSAMTPGG
jgi:AcrR family transcriptional regulator